MSLDPQRRPGTPPYPKQGAGMLSAFVHAWNGLVHTVVHQRNMRVHVVAGLLVALVGSGIPLGLAEKVTLVFCVLLVLFAEVLNSALEQLVDLAIQQFDEKARITKDAAAAGVLVLAIGTTVIFAVVLVANWPTITGSTAEIRRQVLFGVPLAALTAFLTVPWRRPLAVDVLAVRGRARARGDHRHLVDQPRLQRDGVRDDHPRLLRRAPPAARVGGAGPLKNETRQVAGSLYRCPRGRGPRTQSGIARTARAMNCSRYAVWRSSFAGAWRDLLGRDRLLRLVAQIAGDQVDELGGDADDLVRAVTAGAKLVEERAGQDLGALAVSAQSVSSNGCGSVACFDERSPTTTPVPFAHFLKKPF